MAVFHGEDSNREEVHLAVSLINQVREVLPPVRSVGGAYHHQSSSFGTCLEGRDVVPSRTKVVVLRRISSAVYALNGTLFSTCEQVVSNGVGLRVPQMREVSVHGVIQRVQGCQLGRHIRQTRRQVHGCPEVLQHSGRVGASHCGL